ncbi:MAG: dihydroorotase [Pseudobacter sp.]|uniref:dihydroorotase n=1 Tax=Pseudobacter sp. TaxID=2045420 RepID=UPI003F7EC0C1
MKFLIQQAKIINPGSPLESKKQDILIESGIIRDIQPSIQASADRIISGHDLHISPGWVDIFAEFGDPGYEYKETLETGAAAAAAGGFTDVFVVPNTKPVIDNKTQVSYITGRSTSLPSNIHPIGAISRGAEGKELAEMYDMRSAGAQAFSDGLYPVQSAGVLLKALQYVKAFDGIVIQIPDDRSVGSNGLVHEGVVSTRLGLPGKPMMAEELLVARDIKLARYAESKLHFTGVTSPRSLDYIRRAKDAGLSVTCSVTPYHLLFTDEDLMKGYDTNLKVYPHLRPEKERNLLRAAVADGTVDCVTSHHRPHEKDSKVLEFEYAKYGMSGLETCYSALRLAMPEIPEARWVELLSTNPRKIFGLGGAVIEKEAQAHVTIWDAAAHITVNDAFFRSRSHNSAYTGLTLPGKVLGVINGTRASLHSL